MCKVAIQTRKNEYSFDMKKVFGPVFNAKKEAAKETMEVARESTMTPALNVEETTWSVFALRDKVLKLLDDKCIIATHFVGTLANLFTHEKKINLETCPT